jgi:hypothetical protein
MRLSDERFTLLGMITVTYISFLVWFCGWPIPPGIPLDDTDMDTYRKAFENTAIKDEMMSIDFEELMQNDDGATIALVTKMTFRDELKYPSKLPEDFVQAESVDAALSTLAWSGTMMALQYGTAPVAVFNQNGNLIRPVARTGMDGDEDEEDEESGEAAASADDGKWDQVWVIRFRSRRDLLDVLVAFDESGLYAHRVGAIEKLEAAIVTGSSNILFSVDFICNAIPLLGCIILFLLSEACFPGPPKLKEEKKVIKKKKSVVKTDKEGDKDGSKSPKKSSSKKGEQSAAPAKPAEASK